jgi:hypothetical protein
MEKIKLPPRKTKQNVEIDHKETIASPKTNTGLLTKELAGKTVTIPCRRYPRLLYWPKPIAVAANDADGAEIAIESGAPTRSSGC